MPDIPIPENRRKQVRNRLGQNKYETKNITAILIIIELILIKNNGGIINYWQVSIQKSLILSKVVYFSSFNQNILKYVKLDCKAKPS